MLEKVKTLMPTKMMSKSRVETADLWADNAPSIEKKIFYGMLVELVQHFGAQCPRHMIFSREMLRDQFGKLTIADYKLQLIITNPTDFKEFLRSVIELSGGDVNILGALNVTG